MVSTSFICTDYKLWIWVQKKLDPKFLEFFLYYMVWSSKCVFQVNNLICIEKFSDFPQLGRFTLRTEGNWYAILHLIIDISSALQSHTLFYRKNSCSGESDWSLCKRLTNFVISGEDCLVKNVALFGFSTPVISGT